MLLKKLAIFGIACVLIAAFTMIQGCSESEKAVEPVCEVEQTDHIQEQIERADQIEEVIALMDSYVDQNNEGEFVFDEQGFQGHFSSLSESDHELVRYLKGGIPIINAEIGKDRRGETTALGSYCSWHWWGKKCCYTGTQGWTIVSGLAIAGSGGAYFVPLFGAVSGTLAAILNYYMSVYNGFCLNYAWGGLFWVSRP